LSRHSVCHHDVAHFYLYWCIDENLKFLEATLSYQNLFPVDHDHLGDICRSDDRTHPHPLARSHALSSAQEFPDVASPHCVDRDSAPDRVGNGAVGHFRSPSKSVVALALSPRGDGLRTNPLQNSDGPLLPLHPGKSSNATRWQRILLLQNAQNHTLHPLRTLKAGRRGMSTGLRGSVPSEQKASFSLDNAKELALGELGEQIRFAAASIFHQFISDEAPHVINLDYSTRTAVTAHLRDRLDLDLPEDESASLSNLPPRAHKAVLSLKSMSLDSQSSLLVHVSAILPSYDVFDDAVRVIFNMVNRDVFQRFCGSAEYQSMMAVEHRKAASPRSHHQPSMFALDDVCMLVELLRC